MLDPIGAIVAGTSVTIFSGNQFQGPGNSGNQLQEGSSLFFKKSTDNNWASRPLVFHAATLNNKYFAANIPQEVSETFQTGDVIQYYLRISYSDHDTTFIRANGQGSATTDNEIEAQAAPFTLTLQDKAVRGLWQPVFDLPNVAVHANVLPNGQVLMWGRRDRPQDTLDPHECTPFCWDPVTNQVVDTPQPTLADGTKVNLFCAGHTFLPDGRLLVVGGHWADGDGLSQATIYDWRSNTWTPTASMTDPKGREVRRWYPTATTLADGNVLVLSGSYFDPVTARTINVDLFQVWENGRWKTVPTNETDEAGNNKSLTFGNFPLYPRVHVVSEGRVFMSGTNDRTMLFTTTPVGEQTEVGLRGMANRDYCPAVMYAKDKIIYIGGGNDDGTRMPTAEVEIIDLTQKPPRWRKAKHPMRHRRRQHNATVLPDGTILVTGGTRGGGEPNRGFNDLNPGQPVHIAELWEPAGETWTELSAEEVDRCYHSTVVLLPDSSVLSAGGGEYRPSDTEPNAPEDSHRNAQIFFPPYFSRATVRSLPRRPKPSTMDRVSRSRLHSPRKSIRFVGSG